MGTEFANVDDIARQSVDPVVVEAQERFERCLEWEANARARFVDDLKFAYGDSDDGFQWPNALRQNRDVEAKPCLTMNVIRQHNGQIINDSLKNRRSIRVTALGNGATGEAALVMQDLIKHIERQSRADKVAYKLAGKFQVAGGFGFVRLVTDYVDNESNEQDIKILPIEDPLACYLDPDAMSNQLDATFGFYFDDVPKDKFRATYPRLHRMVLGGEANNSPLGVGAMDTDWVSEDTLRVCEYFRKEEKADVLVSFVAGGERKFLLKSKMPKNIYDGIKDHPLTTFRPTTRDEVWWYLIVGQKVVDSTRWPGSYIPLIKCKGEEIVVDGIFDSKSHTRYMKDPQRMLNYNSSAQVEQVALQTKTPWTVPIAAIEELEQIWNTANQVNHAVLPYKHRDDEGEPIPPPQRVDPPHPSAAYEAGMQTAFNQLMMVSGQWQNQMGMAGNERTGEAIRRRQAQGDTATFHFKDNFDDMLEVVGVQILELIPLVYDTSRVRRILADDGMEYEVEIDPTARQAYVQQMSREGQVVKQILNPKVGKYAIATVAGDSYGSAREDTVQALTLILTQAKELAPVIGDLLLKNMDFKDAQEAARRLKRMVPPQALGVGPSQKEQQLMQQVQVLQAELAKGLEKLGKEQVKLIGKQEMREIDVYKAETSRLDSFLKAGVGGKEIEGLVRQLVSEALQTTLKPIMSEATGQGKMEVGDDPEDQAPPVTGARRSPHDGEWYIPDPRPHRKGKHIHVGVMRNE